jgi:hypothetical protein
LLSKSSLSHTFLQKIVIWLENGQFLGSNHTWILLVELLEMVITVIENKVLELYLGETDWETLISLGVKLYWSDVSALHSSHKSNKSFHNVCRALSVLSVQEFEDSFETIDSDFLLEMLYL